jgi:2'-5' RNA ligase
MTVSAQDFKSVYEMLGIDTGELGCIMLDVEPLAISEIVDHDAYYTSETMGYVKGNVSENVPHVTLLYGLMRTGPELRPHVDMVLNGWQAETVTVDKVDFFYGKDDNGTQFVTMIALVKPDENLIEGNGRLRFLPHIDTFVEYRPHITLAYLKNDSNWTEFIAKLNNKYAGTNVTVVGLNYGD